MGQPGHIIRVERLSHAQAMELQRRRDQLSFDVRELKNFEKGTITRIYSRTRYDVQVPGRAYPYEWVPTMEPAFLKLGQVVTMGFVGGNPGIPVILVRQTERRPRLFLGPLEVDLEQWLRHFADQGRTSHCAFTAFSPARCQLLIERWETDPVVAVRIFEDSIYVNTIAGQIVDLTPGASYGIFDPLPMFDDSSVHFDWAMDPDENGNHYLLKGGFGSIVKVDRESRTALWTSSYFFGVSSTIMGGTLALVKVGEEALVAALSLKARAVNLHSRRRADGTTTANAVLAQTIDAPFAKTPGGSSTGETVLRYSGAAGQPWAWDPSSLPTWTWATGYVTGPPALQWHPWAGIFSGDMAAAVYPGQPSGRLSPTSTTLPYWGNTAAGPSANPLTPKQITASLSDGKVIIPVARHVPTLPAYLPDGSLAWELKGWETTPSEGDFHYRDFFCPVMVYSGRLLSITRRVRLLELDYGTASFNTLTEEFYDEEILLTDGHPHYGTKLTLTPTFPTRRMRIVDKVENRFEVFDMASSQRLVSVPFHEQKLKSLFHTVGENVGVLPPPYWSWLSNENYVYPYDGPTYLELYGPTGYDEAIYDADPRDAGGDYYIDSNLNLCVRKATETMERFEGSLRSFYRYHAVERETEIDPPEARNLFGPVLSTDKSLVIFPQGGGTGLGIFSTVQSAKKRAWAAGSDSICSWTGGNQGNGWLHTVTMTGSEFQTFTRRIWEARRWDGSVAWQHYLEFTVTVTSLDFGAGCCCGGGRLVIPYTLNGTRRVRVVNDATGLLVEDVALTIADGLAPGTPRQTILCGGVAILVTDGSIHEILPAETE